MARHSLLWHCPPRRAGGRMKGETVTAKALTARQRKYLREMVTERLLNAEKWLPDEQWPKQRATAMNRIAFLRELLTRLGGAA